MTKPKLAEHIKQLAETRGWSTRRLADELGLQYDRLKRSLKNNSFSEEDLSKLICHYGLEADDFSYSLLGRYCSRSTPRKAQQGLQLTDADWTLIKENKLLAERLEKLIHAECERFRKFCEHKGAT